MEHYLEYIDNEVWKVIQNGNSKKRVTKGKDGVYRVLPPTTQEEQFADEKVKEEQTKHCYCCSKISSQTVSCSSQSLFHKHKPSQAQEVIVLNATSSFKAQKAATYTWECKFKGLKEGSRQEASRGQDFSHWRTRKEALKTIDERQSNWGRNRCRSLGYGIKSNAEVLGYEEEISRGIFALRETDAGYHDIPLYSRFKQEVKYPHHPQSPSPTESDASSTVYSTCQSNDSDGELGVGSDHSVNDDPINDHIPIPSIEQGSSPEHMDHRGIFDSELVQAT
ncbi:hypothetical protein Tco_0015903 [Tanacetum coccineum]